MWRFYSAARIVRRISRDSIQKSLSETSDAVRELVKVCESDRRIIGADCLQHANHSGIRSQKLASNQGR